jgi:hypothetical protein
MDNLRYISLQYIKGDNYEKIQCFKYEEALELLEEIIETQDYSKPTFDALEEIMEEEKCPIGESFLNDLVNYYNFKDIKEKIEGVKKGIEYTGYDSKDGDTRTELIKSLNELIKRVGKITATDNIGNELLTTIKHTTANPSDWTIRKGYNNMAASIINNTRSVYISKIYDKFVDSANKYDLTLVKWDDMTLNGSTYNANTYKDKIKEFADFIIEHDYGNGNIEDLKSKIIEFINIVITEVVGKKEDLLMLLNLLKVVLLYEDSLDAIMALFNKYIKICKRNIGKYEDLFSKNDISNIDDAFMIKSYATFLHKLETLKKNLESKDKTKLERALTNALERLFDLYGINDTETIINDAKSPFYDRLFI